MSFIDFSANAIRRAGLPRDLQKRLEAANKLTERIDGLANRDVKGAAGITRLTPSELDALMNDAEDLYSGLDNSDIPIADDLSKAYAKVRRAVTLERSRRAMERSNRYLERNHMMADFTGLLHDLLRNSSAFVHAMDSIPLDELLEDERGDVAEITSKDAAAMSDKELKEAEYVAYKQSSVTTVEYLADNADLILDVASRITSVAEELKARRASLNGARELASANRRVLGLESSKRRREVAERAEIESMSHEELAATVADLKKLVTERHRS